MELNLHLTKNELPFGFEWAQKVWFKLPSFSKLFTQPYKNFFSSKSQEIHDINQQLSGLIAQAKSDNTIGLDENLVALHQTLDKFRKYLSPDVLLVIQDSNVAHEVKVFYAELSLLLEQIDQLYSICYENTFDWSEEEMNERGWQSTN